MIKPFKGYFRGATLNYFSRVLVPFFLAVILGFQVALADRRVSKSVGISLPPPELLLQVQKTATQFCPLQLVFPEPRAKVGEWQTWKLQGNNCLAQFDFAEANFVMPEHGHGSESVPLLHFNSQKGSVEISRVRLQMPGWWQLKVVFFKKGKSVDGVAFQILILP